jgi:hypothetical protein
MRWGLLGVLVVTMLAAHLLGPVVAGPLFVPAWVR